MPTCHHSRFAICRRSDSGDVHGARCSRAHSDLLRANYEIDVRHLLPSVRVPTLILHRAGDAVVPVGSGRYLAEQIPGAKYAEIPGDDHLVLDNETQDVIADETEEFITGTRRHLEPDRVLATVMFTDIVRSTERAAELGDARWRELLSNYYAVLRKELTPFRGREVNTAGDGLLATLDGPAHPIRCPGSRATSRGLVCLCSSRFWRGWC
jgi:hypothetical protein